MAQQKKNEKNNAPLNRLLVVPAVMLILEWGLAPYTVNNPVAYAFGLIVLISLGYLYVTQVRYLKWRLADKKLRFQLAILFAGFFIPFLGVFIGDYVGASAFSVSANGVPADLGAGLWVGGMLASLFLYVLTIGNAIYIKTNGKSNGLRIVAKVLYVLGYLLIVVVTWLAYQVMYTLHDPSTE